MHGMTKADQHILIDGSFQPGEELLDTSFTNLARKIGFGSAEVAALERLYMRKGKIRDDGSNG